MLWAYFGYLDRRVTFCLLGAFGTPGRHTQARASSPPQPVTSWPHHHHCWLSTSRRSAGRYLERFSSVPRAFLERFDGLDGLKIVSASGDKTVRVWSASSGTCEQTMTGHTSNVNSAAFSPDGLKIVSASEDTTVRVWSVATCQCDQTLRSHGSYVRSAAFSPEGRQIVSASRDKTVRVWDATTGENQKILTGHTDYVNSARFGAIT